MRMRQDKGHQEEVRSFLLRVAHGGGPLIPFDELELVTRATYAVVRSTAEGRTVRLDTADGGVSDPARSDTVMV